MCHGINEFRKIQEGTADVQRDGKGYRIISTEFGFLCSTANQAPKRELLLCKKNTEHLNNLMWASETKIELASLSLKDCLE